MTMLMLFKLWWSGTDLKMDHESWEEAFDEHNFSWQALELMDYFDSFYQCKDAHNDMSRNCKQGITSGLEMLGLTSDDLDAIEDEIDKCEASHEMGQTLDNHIVSALETFDMPFIGESKILDEHAEKLHELLWRSGWNCKANDMQSGAVGAVCQFVTGDGGGPAFWKKRLDDTHAMLIELHNSQAPKENVWCQ
jgi:hypothetical protein